MRRRLIPEGMEWPRFEDGEPVGFGCEFEFEGAVDVIESITFHCAGSPRFNYGLQDSGERVHGLYVRGERVKRPAPKVLDADGAEIRAGDVLYSIETGGSVVVEAVEPGNAWFAATSGTLQHCSKFTHRTPVLAADGKPLREGETVWHKSGFAHGVVESIDAGSLMHTTRYRDENGVEYRDAAKDLTHERPDSWERLEADVRAWVSPTMEERAEIVRRAKKLARVIG